MTQFLTFSRSIKGSCRALALPGLLGLALGIGAPTPVQAADAGSFFHFLTPSLTPTVRGTLSHFPAFQEGPAQGPTVNILFLPGCPHCLALWQSIELLRQTNPEADRLQYRWIPVVLGAQQAALLAPYWQGPRNEETLTAFMRNELRTHPVRASLSAAQAADIEQQTRPALHWLRATGAQVVPAIIGSQGTHPVLHIGDPNPVRLERWLGLPGPSRP